MSDLDETDCPSSMKKIIQSAPGSGTNSIRRDSVVPTTGNKKAENEIYSEFWEIGEFSEKLLNKTCNGDVVIGVDVDWPATYKTVLSKTSQIHICYGIKKCAILKVRHILSLPRVFILLLKHPKVKLAGYQLSKDLSKLGQEFRFDVNSILEKLESTEVLPDVKIHCCHDWDLKSVLKKSTAAQGTSIRTRHLGRSLFKFLGEVKYSNNFLACGAAAEELLVLADGYPNGKYLILGFDLEWPFNFRTGSGKVALVQICPSKDLCYILHIPKLTTLPKTLVLLLNHKKVKLVGVNISNDIRKIGRDFKIETRNIIENNIVELEKFANEVLRISERWSLDRLILHLFDVELEKPGNVRRSNWAQEKLSELQVIYAATDAYAGLEVYNYLKGLEEDLSKEDTLPNNFS